jgi:hypothetical protein
MLYEPSSASTGASQHAPGTLSGDPSGAGDALTTGLGPAFEGEVVASGDASVAVEASTSGVTTGLEEEIPSGDASVAGDDGAAEQSGSTDASDGALDRGSGLCAMPGPRAAMRIAPESTPETKTTRRVLVMSLLLFLDGGAS